MSITEWIVSQRLVFPHLGATYDELPVGVRARVSRNMAQRFDVHVNEARAVIEDASGGDPALRRDLLRQMAAAVVPHWWPAIIVDTAKDFAENVVAPVSFYGRLGEPRSSDQSSGAWSVRPCGRAHASPCAILCSPRCMS